MNEIQVFENTQFGKVRIVTIDGEPWLVGKDVATALGYSNPRDALRVHVDDEDKNTVVIHDGIPGNPNMTVINESGLYSLVLSSKLPDAKKFRRWVTSEVLPSIRRNGGYIAGQDTLSDTELLAKAVLVAQKTIEERNARIRELEAQNEANAPKVIFADAVSASGSSILIGDLAKLLKQNGVEDMGQNRLFAWMRKNGYLIRRKGTDHNMPTQRSMEMGLFRVKETTVVHSDGHVTVNKTPKVSGKGQRYFINLFLSGKRQGEGRDMEEGEWREPSALFALNGKDDGAVFHGSLPASALQIQASIVKEWNVDDIYVGCSGNFTCERMLQNVTDARLHSNDVTIYSCLLGEYFSGKPLDVKFKDSYDGPMAFVRDYMKTDADMITVMLLLSKMGTYLASKPNPFYEKMIEAYKTQWDRLFNETKAKVEKIGPFIADFFAGDVCQWIDEVPKEAGFICYPPFYSGDYDRYIKPGSETAAYGVLVDGKLIGVYAFSASPTLANWHTHIATPTMYLLSDFPVTPTKYKRLAKLVLYAALSKESKLLAERLTNKRIRSLVTTAFTKRQMSMKYRGLFDLLNKKKLPGVDEGETDLSKRYYNEGYQLNYGAAMGQWTLQEGLALWKRKHSQTGRGAEE